MARWADGIEGMHGCIAGRFGRPEPRRRAVESGVPFAWVARDEVYSNDRNLRLWLERQWDGWYRHITLEMLAHAYLSVINHQAMEQGEKGAATVRMKSRFR